MTNRQICTRRKVKIYSSPSPIPKYRGFGAYLKVHKREKFFVSDFEFFTIL